jgi:hypothetical protein
LTNKENVVGTKIAYIPHAIPPFTFTFAVQLEPSSV